MADEGIGLPIPSILEVGGTRMMLLSLRSLRDGEMRSIWLGDGGNEGMWIVYVVDVELENGPLGHISLVLRLVKP